MKYILLTVLSLTLLMACATKKKEAAMLEMTKPQWLKNRPVSSTHFYGIGITAKVGGSAYYTEKAKDNALSDLARQISTKIKSEQNLYRMEDNTGVYEYMQSRIKATSNEFLEGYEYVDSWEDLNNYYTFYRLSKSDFYARKAKRKSDALQLSLDKYRQAQKAEQANDFILALEQYAAAIDAISDYLNEQTSVTGDQGPVDVYEVSRDALCDLINALQIRFEPTRLQADAANKIGARQALAHISCRQEVAPAIPVRFNFSGGFLVQDKAKTDAKGELATPALQLENETAETLEASIDLKTLGRQLSKNLIVRQMIEKQKAATASLSLHPLP